MWFLRALCPRRRLLPDEGVAAEPIPWKLPVRCSFRKADCPLCLPIGEGTGFADGPAGRVKRCALEATVGVRLLPPYTIFSIFLAVACWYRWSYLRRTFSSL